MQLMVFKPTKVMTTLRFICRYKNFKLGSLYIKSRRKEMISINSRISLAPHMFKNLGACEQTII